MLSERSLSEEIGLSRTSLRKVVSANENLNLKTIEQVAQHFDQNTMVITYPKYQNPICSTVATSYKIKSDGFDSWKIHIMDMVDEFRRTLDVRLFILPPDYECTPKIRALIASVVITLCEEANVTIPDWVTKVRSLDKPWFVSEMESLKASALLESPMGFRKYNIFVHENFLMRA